LRRYTSGKESDPLPDSLEREAANAAGRALHISPAKSSNADSTLNPRFE